MKNKKIMLATTLTIAVLFAVVLTGCGKNKSAQNGTSGESPSSQTTQAPTYVEDNQIAQVYADPDNFKGRYINVTGQVFGKIEKQNGKAYFQMYHDTENSEDNTVVEVNAAGLEVKEGDYVIIDGEIAGSYEEQSTQNIFGEDVEAVSINANSVEVSDYTTVAAPAVRAFTMDSSVNQNGYVVSVTRIEFAEKETRVYFEINNKGKNTFNFDSDDVKIVQGKTQYEEQNNSKADYEKPQSKILEGVKSDGVIAFPAMAQDEDVQIVCEASSSDSSETFSPYRFNIEISKAKQNESESGQNESGSESDQNESQQSES